MSSITKKKEPFLLYKKQKERFFFLQLWLKTATATLLFFLQRNITMFFRRIRLPFIFSHIQRINNFFTSIARINYFVDITQRSSFVRIRKFLAVLINCFCLFLFIQLISMNNIDTASAFFTILTGLDGTDKKDSFLEFILLGIDNIIWYRPLLYMGEITRIHQWRTELWHALKQLHSNQKL